MSLNRLSYPGLFVSKQNVRTSWNCLHTAHRNLGPVGTIELNWSVLDVSCISIQILFSYGYYWGYNSQHQPTWPIAELKAILEFQLKLCMMPLERLSMSMRNCLRTLLWYYSAHAFKSGKYAIHQVSVKVKRRVKFLYMVPQFSLLFYGLCVCTKWHSSCPGFV